MLIIALVLAGIGLAALVTAVVTSNELIAWVCIAASVLGVILLIVDAVRERSRSGTDEPATESQQPLAAEEFDADYPEESADADLDADTSAVPFDERHEDRVADEERVADEDRVADEERHTPR
ncbi:DUF308 domain-containing protein [Mycobacterium sp. PS03-16]|uniref:DUF308 domain-containing protein n=1 Tax=Mycobacterium sp. PS03-16 TaxID=2559611 RepID=UPI001FD7E38B|nr:DUF308 domain-containing protein [Mycobacterium sp. PS03-16]